MFQWLFKWSRADFLEGELGLLYSPRIEFILLGLAIILVGTWWLYGRNPKVLGRPGLRVLLSILRSAGIILLILLILGPLLRLRKNDDTKDVIAIGFDVSKSMSLPMGSVAGKRFDNARRLLTGKDNLIERLAGSGEVRVFAIGAGTRLVKPVDLGGMDCADDETRLAAGIKDIAQSTGEGSLAAMILLTDGVDTSANNPSDTARYAAQMGIPIHTVGFGNQADLVDTEILSVRAPHKAQPGTLVDVTVLVRRGSVKDPLEVKLFQDVRPLKAKTVPTVVGSELATVSMNFIPEGKGTTRYTVKLTPAPGEKILNNNERAFQIDLLEDRVEVLFVEGSPRHEYAFIRRTMWDNRYFKVVTLLRLGKGRYFRSGGDTKDRFLVEGFPKTAEELGRFRAIILSDIEAGFFTKEQLQLIADFVKVRGGGLLLLGGVNSYNLGAYNDTPVAGVLPVELPSKETPFIDQEFRFDITREGSEHEILRLTPDPSENAAQWALMPPLKGYNPCFKPKAGTRILGYYKPAGPESRVFPPDKTPIILAVADVGAGRSAAFASANSWRWQMLSKSGDDCFGRFWAQMIRWLAVGSKESLTVTTDRDIADLNQPVTITANVSDKAYKPFNEAKVKASIKDPFGIVQEVNMPWCLTEDGVYQAVCRPPEKGEYVVTVNADLAGTVLPPVETSFVAIQSAMEFAKPGMDGPMLEQIAHAGGGTVNLEGNAEKAVKEIRATVGKRRKLMALVQEKEFRDAPFFLLLTSCIFFAEWIFRKRNGLA